MATPQSTHPIATATAAGHQVLDMRLDMPMQGAWSATVEDDSEASPVVGDLIDIIITPQAEGAVKVLFLGTVVWGAPWQGRSRYEVVGGTGGLRNVLPARGYKQLPLGAIVADIVVSAGETLADGVQSTLDALAGVLPYWLRVESTAAASLTRLCQRFQEFNLVWRVLDDGTVFVGAVSYAEDATRPFVTDPGDLGHSRVVTCAPDAATLRPDTTISSRKVFRVVYTISTEGLRAELFYPADELRTDSEDMERMVRTWLPELPYAQQYAATITAVRPSARVEVRADTSSVGELDGAEMLVGCPEMAVTPTAGQRARLCFSAARPDLPYMVGFEQDAGANKGVARVGDTVDCGYYTAVAPPGGGPCTVTSGGGPGVPGSFKVTGTITSGHPRVMLTNAGQ